MKSPLLRVSLRYEDDVVTARQRARHIAQQLQFDTQDQTRIATSVSEIARNAVTYGGGGRAEFFVEGDQVPQRLVIEISDTGPGIAQLEEVLSGHYRSSTGMGLGIIGARRLLDSCDIDSGPNGTAVRMRKSLPHGARFVGSREIAELAQALEAQLQRRPLTLMDEIRQQNNELVKALEELESRKRELDQLNGELFDTNRGVLALYAELEDRAENLRRADDLKSRFLSNMSHEFRTPLNSILALSQLLTDQVDGALASEQHRQVGYIRKSATELLDLVNDLLDLAKVESGKIILRLGEFSVDDLFSTLRGMLRPMITSTRVELLFDDAVKVPHVHSDEAKITQILRNFLANALKFTDSGEIRVSACGILRGEFAPTQLRPCERDSVLICVADTGIGIAAADCERIFEEFSQIDNPVQHRVRGTGLGLPLCRKLAAVLGAEIFLESELGVGSRFYLLVPRGAVATDLPEVV